MGRAQCPEERGGRPLRERRRGAEQARQDRSGLSYELTDQARADLERFLAELRRWAERMNLVGSTRPEEVEAHVSDSLAAAPSLPRGARVVDLGTGAGFPGVPILIARPDLELVLVERREKRVHFLRQVVRVLDLACEVRRCSIEEAPGAEDRFDYVLLRAVAPAARALEWARPWARPEGEIWLWTLESAFPDRFVEVGAIPLGDRGRIARLRGAAVSRGTP